MWAAPVSQGGCAAAMALVGCSHMSGLLWLRSDDRWPRWVTRIGSQTGTVMSEHHRTPRGVPILGSTDCHLAVAVLARLKCARSRWWVGSGLRRLAVGLAAHHHGPDDTGHLVGQRHRRQLLRLARQQGQQPQRSAARLGGADHRGRPDHQQAPQIFVAGAADPTELLSPGGRVSRGVMPIQEAKCRPERKACGSATPAFARAGS